MVSIILSYLGGVLTIFSPCILPVIPFVFSRSDQPFRKSGLPMLIGMGLSFAFFATLSVVGGDYIIHANQMGRILALGVFAILGFTLIFPRIAESLTAPFVRLGGILQARADKKTGIGSSLMLGASIGLLWAPCAGPILGLVLASAAWDGSNERTFGLLLVFAMGAATSLGFAIVAGSKVVNFLKKSFGAEEWIRRIIGASVLCTVIAISFGFDTKILSKLSYINTGRLEQALIDHVSLGTSTVDKVSTLADEDASPPLDGATEWINSAPLSIASLRGKVVLIDFWTYSCINCLRTLPYLKAWDEKYGNQGLVIIGVHTPEFAFEKSIENIKNAVTDLKIKYPVAVDSKYVIWSAFKNQYWPAHYFLDANGHIRSHHFGEGNYDESEKLIQTLLAESHGSQLSTPIPDIATTRSSGTGVEAPSRGEAVASPETYLGYARQAGFVSTPDIQKDTVAVYKIPPALSLNQWGFSGSWKIASENAQLITSHGKLAFRFRARDLHLVAGAPEGRTIQFRVTIDGSAPKNSHGQDVDVNGYGKLNSHRLYQLIRQSDESEKVRQDHTFQIEFLQPGAEVFSFTFG